MSKLSIGWIFEGWMNRERNIKLFGIFNLWYAGFRIRIRILFSFAGSGPDPVSAPGLRYLVQKVLSKLFNRKNNRNMGVKFSWQMGQDPGSGSGLEKIMVPDLVCGLVGSVRLDSDRNRANRNPGYMKNRFRASLSKGKTEENLNLMNICISHILAFFFRISKCIILMKK